MKRLRHPIIHLFLALLLASPVAFGWARLAVSTVQTEVNGEAIQALDENAGADWASLLLGVTGQEEEENEGEAAHFWEGHARAFAPPHLTEESKEKSGFWVECQLPPSPQLESISPPPEG